jgi:hypothetical protein
MRAVRSCSLDSAGRSEDGSARLVAFFRRGSRGLVHGAALRMNSRCAGIQGDAGLVKIKKRKAARTPATYSGATIFLRVVGGMPGALDLNQFRLRGNLALDMNRELDVIAIGVHALCGIWANSKSFLLAPGRRADRVGQQATQRTASTGMSGRIPISSEELQKARL